MVLRCKGCNNVISDKATKCPECGVYIPERPRGRKLVYWILGILVGLPVLGAILPEAREPASAPAPAVTTGKKAAASAVPAVSKTPKADPPAPKRLSTDEVLAQIRLSNLTWKKDGFDTVMLVSFTVQNPADVAVKDLELTCTHSANSGTTIDKNTKVIYEKLGPKSKRSFTDFNMGFIHPQATRTSCQVTQLTLL
jgi:hypothetical protein